MKHTTDINKERFDLIKEITKELRKKYKGIQSNAYGYCCNSDYDTYHKYINNNDYVCAKIYKGGLNNDYINGCFMVGREIYFSWNLNNFRISDICDTMRAVVKHKADIIEPTDKSKCIALVFR